MRSERRTTESKEWKIKGGSCSRPYLNTSTCHWFIYRLDSTAVFPDMPLTWLHVWLAGFFYYPAQTFWYRTPRPHSSGRRYSQAENGHGTMPFILTVGVTLSCVRDECARLSVPSVDTTRDVKLTYLSGSRGRPAWEQPCCVMRLVTEHKVRTLVILMCGNSSNNRPRRLVATVRKRRWKSGHKWHLKHEKRCHFQRLDIFFLLFSKSACKKSVRRQQVRRIDQVYRQHVSGPVSSLKSNTLHSDMLSPLLRDGLQHSHKPAH